MQRILLRTEILINVDSQQCVHLHQNLTIGRLHIAQTVVVLWKKGRNSNLQKINAI